MIATVFIFVFSLWSLALIVLDPSYISFIYIYIYYERRKLYHSNKFLCDMIYLILFYSTEIFFPL